MLLLRANSSEDNGAGLTFADCGSCACSRRSGLLLRFGRKLDRSQQEGRQLARIVSVRFCWLGSGSRFGGFLDRGHRLSRLLGMDSRVLMTVMLRLFVLGPIGRSPLRMLRLGTVAMVFTFAVGAGMSVMMAITPFARMLLALLGKALHGLSLDRLTDQFFDRRHIPFVAPADKHDRMAGSSRSSGTADTVDVIIGLHGHIKIENVAHGGNIESTRCYVACDK